MQKCHHFLNRSLLRAEPKKMHVVNCKEIQAIPAWHPFRSEFNLICKNHPFFEITKNVLTLTGFHQPFYILSSSHSTISMEVTNFHSKQFVMPDVRNQ